MGDDIVKVMIPTLDDPFKGGGIGGKHTHIRLLAAGLKDLGVESHIICPREDLRFRFFRKYPGALGRRLMFDRERAVESWNQQRIGLMRRAIRKDTLDCQVLNPQDTLSLSIVAEELRSRQIKRPLVLTVHGYFVRELVSAESLDPSLPMVEELLRQELSTYELATRLICVDTRIRDYIHDNAGIDKERMAIIPNAVNTVEFHPIDDGSMLALRDALGIPRGSRVLLCPRRLVPKNGVEYAVKAMRTISRTVDDALLIIAGDGPLRDHLQGLIRNEGLEGHVRLIGGVAHGSMPAYYQCADIVVIPSVPSQGVEEATSLSMLEGMACAKPVMVTDIGGLKETVVDGSNGYMVSAGDPEGIAHAAVRIFDDKEGSEAVAQNALLYVRREHSHTVHARKVLDQYRLALDTGI